MWHDLLQRVLIDAHFQVQRRERETRQNSFRNGKVSLRLRPIAGIAVLVRFGSGVLVRFGSGVLYISDSL